MTSIRIPVPAPRLAEGAAALVSARALAQQAIDTPMQGAQLEGLIATVDGARAAAATGARVLREVADGLEVASSSAPPMISFDVLQRSQQTASIASRSDSYGEAQFALSSALAARADGKPGDLAPAEAELVSTRLRQAADAAAEGQQLLAAIERDGGTIEFADPPAPERPTPVIS